MLDDNLKRLLDGLRGADAATATTDLLGVWRASYAPEAAMALLREVQRRLAEAKRTPDERTALAILLAEMLHDAPESPGQ